MSAPSASFSSPSATTLSRLVSPVSTSTRTSKPRWRHQLLEDRLAGRERLGRRLGGLELGAFGGQGAAGGGDLGRLAAVRSAAAATGGARVVATRSVRGRGAAGRRGGGRSSRRGGRSRRGPSDAGASVVARPVVAGPVVARAVVAARSAVAAVVAAGPRSIACGRSSRGRVVAAVRAAAGGSGTAAAASRFGAAPPSAERGAATIRAGSAPMPEDAPAARGQDLEVEVVEPGAEGLAGVAQGLLDGLAGELLVCTHVSVVSLVGPDGPARGGGSSVGRASSCRRRSGWPHACSGRVAVASRPGSAGCGRRRSRGPAEEREHAAPADDEVLLDDREDRGHDPVDEQAGRQERAVEIEMSGRNSIVWRWIRCSGSSFVGSAAGSIIRVWTSWRRAETIARMLSPNEPGERAEERRRLARRRCRRTTG